MTGPDPIKPRPVSRNAAESVGLPIRPFLYTLDQLCTVLGYGNAQALTPHLYFRGRSTGPPPRFVMVAQDIAAEGDRPEWRVPEAELLRWLRAKGFKVHEIAWVGSSR